VLGFCLLALVAWALLPQGAVAGPKGETGILERLVAADGTVTVDLDATRLNGARSKSPNSTLRFDVSSETFLTSLAFNDEFRGTLPGTLSMNGKNAIQLPAKLGPSQNDLVVEVLPWGGDYEMVIRDGKTGFTFFNVEGYEYDYVAAERKLNIRSGALLLSDEFAADLGRETKTVVGKINIELTMNPIEITHIVEGETQNSVLPPTNAPEAGNVPGPDVIVGELSGLAQFGASSGTQVGLAVGTDSCNFGTIPLNWFANPSNDHPVIPQNLYRMSANGDRFEQIGQSQVKHAFTALQNNICNLGCVANPNGTALGSGCSDPYSASLNSGPSLGSKAWINPFTGFFPRNDSATPNNNHTGHTHLGPTHRILTEVADLNPSLNPGATYYTEAQYVTPHEYAHCQANPTQCNMYNNVSYRRYNITASNPTCPSGSSSCFSFSTVSGQGTVRMKPAIEAWTGASIVEVRPAPGVDGVAYVAYKITNPSAGVWHYEYAVYNMNLDRAIQSFSIPVGNGVTLSNIGFRMPPQHPGSSADGTFNNLGFSSTPWTSTQDSGSLTWSSESLAQNQNANAIRWSTMYNFRFDSNRPPAAGNATLGFLKTGSPMNVAVQIPSATTANVTVSGRVTLANGQGIVTTVAIVGPNNFIRWVNSNSFGFFTFNDIPTGATYSVEVSSKRYIADPINVQVNDHITNVNIIATEQ
jgi:hypothetical protein